MNPRPLLLPLAVLLLALAVGEWAVGRWLQAPQASRHDPSLGRVVEPGARVVQSAEGWGSFRAGADGLLDRPLPPPGDGVRAVLLGDSFAQGLQVPDTLRMSEVAERLHPGLHVLNAAAAGRTPYHYAWLAPRLHAAFAPDLMLVQVNDGDLTDILSDAGAEDARREFQGPVGATHGGRGPGAIGRWLLRHSALAAYLRTRSERLVRQERDRLALKLSGRRPDLRDVVALPVAPLAAQRMDSLLTEIRRVNPHMVLVYMPNVDYFHDPPCAMYPERRAWYRAFADAHHLPIVDGTDAFLQSYGADREFLHGFANSRPAYGHLNARGHTVMARELVAALAREGLLGDARP